MALAATQFAISGLIFLLITIPVAATELPPWNFVCICHYADGNYTLNSTYRANIMSLATSLPYYATSNPALFTAGNSGNAPDIIYARAMCRGDSNASSCFSCVSSAIRKAQEHCPLIKGVITFSDPCVLHFSNLNFPDEFDKGNLINAGDQNVSAAVAPKFMAATSRLLNATMDAAAADPVRRFAMGEEAFDNETYPKIFAMVQCTPDLMATDCLICLKNISQFMRAIFVGKQGGKVSRVWCNFQYETYPFFKGRPVVQLQSPFGLPPSSAPNPVDAVANRKTIEGSKKNFTKIVLIVSASVAVALLFPCIYFLIWHRKGKRLWFPLCKKTSSNTEKNYEAMIVSYGSLDPKRYMYSEVMKMTSSRSDQLGEGGYGVVFKGKLQDGHFVGVKFLHDCKGNSEDFVNEVMSMGKTSHVNVVSLHGFCLDRSKRALIYEYMPNGSLDKYIYSENPKGVLGWERLYAIAIGIARGLEYLHYSCNTRIVHFDIKPQNILLDKDLNLKIADFGLAKLSKESKLSMTGGARGTVGFIAPEVFSQRFGEVSIKSDVYSYGMMLLEMAGGRKNVKSCVEKSSKRYFPDWIHDHFMQDDGLQACEVTGKTEEIARKMILIGLWCIRVIPVNRPTIKKVLEMF